MGTIAAQDLKFFFGDNLSVRMLGCVVDGVTDDTLNFQKAINSAAGTGTALMIPGDSTLLCGAITLPSNLILIGRPGATIRQKGGMVGAASFSGSGINDATSGGGFTDTATDTFLVIIDGTGSPDTFKWNKNGGSFTTGVHLTGSAQPLSNGVTITFAATTGHTLSAQWTIVCTPSTAAANVPWITNSIQSGSGNNKQIISGVTFDGNRSNQPPILIANYGTDRRDILQFINVTSVSIRDCRFINSIRSAITGALFNDIEVLNCFFQTWAPGNVAAINFDGSEGGHLVGGGSVYPPGGVINTVRIQGCHVDGGPSVSSCINVGGSASFPASDISISNNTCLMESTLGYLTDNTFILAIQIWSPTYPGYTNFTVSGNVIDGGSAVTLTDDGRFGISVAGPGGTSGSIVGNTIQHCGFLAIECGTNYLTVQGNNTYDCGPITCNAYGPNDRANVTIIGNVVRDPVKGANYPTVPRQGIAVQCGDQDSTGNHSVYDVNIIGNEVSCSVDTNFVGIWAQNQNTESVLVNPGVISRLKVALNSVIGNGLASGIGIKVAVDPSGTGTIDHLTCLCNDFSNLANAIYAMVASNETNSRYLFNRFNNVTNTYVNQPSGNNMAIDIDISGVDLVIQSLIIRGLTSETLDSLGNINIPTELAVISNNSSTNTGPNLLAWNWPAFGGGGSPSPYFGTYLSLGSRWNGSPNWAQMGSSSYTKAMFVNFAAARFQIQFGNAVNTNGSVPGTAALTIEGDTVSGGIGELGIFSGTSWPFFPQQQIAALYGYNGNPNTHVTANLGSICLDPSSGGLWLKTSGSGSSGWSAVSTTPGINQLTGDVTAGPGSGSQVATITASAVTLAKMANLAADSIIGNNTGSSATPIALTQAQVTALLNVFTSSLQGLVPASGGGTANFLRADGSWVAPVTGVTSLDTMTGAITITISNSGTGGARLSCVASGGVEAFTLAQPGAWTAYTPSTTNMSAVSTDAAYQETGKSCAVRIGITGTMSGNLNFTCTLPFSPVSNHQTFVAIANLSGAIFSCAVLVSGTTLTVSLFNNAVFNSGGTYTWSISGTYETT